MKKIFACVILMAILFTGCASSTTASKISGSNNSAVSQLSIYNYQAFNNDADAIKTWEDYMLEKYNIEIKLDSSTDERTMYLSVWNGNKTGIMNMSMGFIPHLISQNRILPLTDYLKDNKAWNALPESYRKKFEVNGEIWAVPTSESVQIVTRVMNEDLLKELSNGKVPNDLDEFTALCDKLKALDDSFDVAVYNYLMGDSTFYDIFNAYGMYFMKFSLQKSFPLAYDPVEDKFVDCMFKPQAKEALSYLRKLYQNGIIDPKAFTANKDSSYPVDCAELNTTMKQTFTPIKPFKPYQNSNKYPLSYTTNGYGYVMAEGTAHPKETINALVDLLYGSKQSYLDCFMGLPDTYTARSDGVFIFKKDENNKYRSTPNLVNASSIMLGQQAIFVRDDYSEDNINTLKERANSVNQYLKDNENMLAEIPVMYQSPISLTYTLTFDAYYGYFKKLMVDAITNDKITVDEAIETYQYNVETFCSLDDILKEANQAIGK